MAAVYAETFARLCAGTFPEVVEESRAHDPAVRRVLDVGAGTRRTGLFAQDDRKRGGRRDPDPEMLRLVVEACPGVESHEAALPSLPFPAASFDAVVANFVINHLPNPRAGVDELCRVAAVGLGSSRPFGRPEGRNTQSRLWAAVTQASDAVALSSVRLPDELDFRRTPEGMADLLIGGGLSDAGTRTLTWIYRAPPDAMWRGAAAGVAGIGRTLISQSPEVRTRMKSEYDRLVADLTTDGQIEFATDAILGVGGKPRRPTVVGRGSSEPSRQTRSLS